MPTRAQLSKNEEQQGRHTHLMRAALSGDIDALKVSLAGGADVNKRDDEGRTPLMFATVNRQTECAKELLLHGADVNARGNDGGTALMLAASSGAAKLVKDFLARGADTSGKYIATGQTALTIARDHGYDDIVELLQAAGAKQ